MHTISTFSNTEMVVYKNIAQDCGIDHRTVKEYFQKQLAKLIEDKSEILIRLKSFKQNSKFKDSKVSYFPQQQLIKLLKTNNRTINLLAKEKLIKNSFGFMKPVFSFSDIIFFIQSLK